MATIQEMKSYYRRVRATDLERMGNVMLSFLAEYADEFGIVTHSIDDIAYESGFKPKYFHEFLTAFRRNGIITMEFAYSMGTEKYECERIVLHGPWDRYNWTGVPFAEYAMPTNVGWPLPEWVCEAMDRGFPESFSR